MKKTEKTAMTAALFAVAMNVAPTGTTASAADTHTISIEGGTSAKTAISEEYDPVREITTTNTVVYGPPWVFSTTTTTTTSVEQYDPIKEIVTTNTVVYGPPPVFTTVPDNYSEPVVGDVNNDGATDVFDLVTLRKIYIEAMNGGELSGSYVHDINGDGKLTVADLVVLQKYLLGQIGSLDSDPSAEPAVTTIPVDSEVTVRTTTVPVYGPPWAFDKTTTAAPESDRETTPTTVIQYDPIDTTTTAAPVTEPEDDVTRPTTVPVYGPPWALDTKTTVVDDNT